MKILLATYWEIPHLGGVWPLMQRLAHALADRGHEVDLFGNAEAYYHVFNRKKRYMKSDYRPLLESHLNGTMLARSPIIYNTELDRYMMELVLARLRLADYDLIHVQDAIAGRAAARVKPPHVPLLVNPHGSLKGEIRLLIESNGLPNIQLNLLKSYYERMETAGLMSATHITTSSRWLKQIFVQEHGIPEKRISVSPYGIPIEPFKAKMRIPNEFLRPYGKKVIAFAGRMVHLKGIEILLHALKALQAIRQDWVCWMIGEGAERERYTALTAELGLQQYVTFLGPRQDIPRLLALTDIYVQPSLQDNQPLSVIEAQIAGKAVVVSPATGLPEMVEHGATGWVVPVHTPDGWCQQLNEVLENTALRQKLQQEAKRQAAEHWSIQRYHKDIFRQYYALTGKKV